MKLNSEHSEAIIELYNNRSILEADVVLPNGEKLERCTVKRKDMGRNHDYISTSRIESFANCPSMFKQTFIDQTLDTSNVFTENGTFLHSMMERYIKHYIETREVLTITELSREFEESEVVDYGNFRDVCEMVNNFITANPITEWTFEPLDVEREFVINWDGTVVSGIIDCIGVDKNDKDTLVIVDWKSNYLPWTNEELKSSLQLHLYSVVCKELYPFAKQVKTMYGMVKICCWQVTPMYSDEELEQTKQYVISMDKKINNSDFEPKLNTYCCYRDCRHTCEVYKRAVELGTAVVPTGTLEQRDFYYAIEKNSSALRKKCDRELKELIQKDGSIKKNGYEYSINTIKMQTLDYKKLNKVLLSHNRLDLANGFIKFNEKETERFLLMVNQLDDLALKLDIFSCVQNLYEAKAISKHKIVE